MSTTEGQTFPATSGTVVGWAGLAACVLLLVVTLIQATGLEAVRWAVVLVLAGLVIYAFMLRPRVRVLDGTIVLVNPLVDVHVPMGLITGFTIRQATFVFVEDKRYVGVAIGRPLRQLVRGGQDTAPMAPPGLGKLSRVGSDQMDAASSRNLTIDLLEDKIRRGRVDAHGSTSPGVVHREPVWWLIGAIGVVALAVVVLFVVG